MRTFWIQTLGCKVNQYESEQIATLLRARGLIATGSPEQADLRVINTCSVTIQAASKSRQLVRRSVRLRVLQNLPSPNDTPPSGWIPDQLGSTAPPEDCGGERGTPNPRVIVTGCWATSNQAEARDLPGVDAVIGHHENVNQELNRLLDCWMTENTSVVSNITCATEDTSPELEGDEIFKMKAGNPAVQPSTGNKPQTSTKVKKNPAVGTRSLPLLEQRQSGHQRALLKIQDGCDAHCTYCIIPQLRGDLWSKPIDKVVDEARRLVDAGHVELVLTGIFMGAYGEATAVRKRQSARDFAPLAGLINALCTHVRGLRRLRFSSMEPGDLSAELVYAMKSHAQIVPHFHLPLQSGSDVILRRMNRQYRRDDFVRMIERVYSAFDRPAITTDIIVGFPGESDREFQATLDAVDRARFIHIHAFSFSPRPGTAAARWEGDFVRGPVVNDRVEHLRARAATHSLEFRRQFVGQVVEVLVERPHPFDTLRHGRSERYFDVHFYDPTARPGDAVRLIIDRVTPQRTFGHKVGIEGSGVTTALLQTGSTAP